MKIVGNFKNDLQINGVQTIPLQSRCALKNPDRLRHKMIDNLWVISEKFEQTNDFLVCIDSYECFQVAHKRCLSAYRRCFFSKYGQFRANSVEMMSLTEARGNVPPVTVHKLTCVPGVHNYAHHLTICRFALPCMVSHIL